MDQKEIKRRRNLRLILAFFVLLWIGLSTGVYFRDTSAAKIYTRKGWSRQQALAWIVRDSEGYRCVLDSDGWSVLGSFTFEHKYNWYASRIGPILKEEWDMSTLDERFPHDADKEKLIDEGYALLVADGSLPNWPNIPRAQTKKYVVEYPNLQAKNKRTIAVHAFGSTAPGLAILCGFVLVARHIWIASRDSPRPGICPDCDYNLEGLDQQQCPECGRAFNDEEWYFHMPW